VFQVVVAETRPLQFRYRLEQVQQRRLIEGGALGGLVVDGQDLAGGVGVGFDTDRRHSFPAELPGGLEGVVPGEHVSGGALVDQRFVHLVDPQALSDQLDIADVVVLRVVFQLPDRYRQGLQLGVHACFGHNTHSKLRGGRGALSAGRLRRLSALSFGFGFFLQTRQLGFQLAYPRQRLVNEFAGWALTDVHLALASASEYAVDALAAAAAADEPGGAVHVHGDAVTAAFAQPQFRFLVGGGGRADFGDFPADEDAADADEEPHDERRDEHQEPHGNSHTVTLRDRRAPHRVRGVARGTGRPPGAGCGRYREMWPYSRQDETTRASIRSLNGFGGVGGDNTPRRGGLSGRLDHTHRRRDAVGEMEQLHGVSGDHRVGLRPGAGFAASVERHHHKGARRAAFSAGSQVGLVRGTPGDMRHDLFPLHPLHCVHSPSLAATTQLAAYTHTYMVTDYREITEEPPVLASVRVLIGHYMPHLLSAMLSLASLSSVMRMV